MPNVKLNDPRRRWGHLHRNLMVDVLIRQAILPLYFERNSLVNLGNILILVENVPDDRIVVKVLHVYVYVRFFGRSRLLNLAVLNLKYWDFGNDCFELLTRRFHHRLPPRRLRRIQALVGLVADCRLVLESVFVSLLFDGGMMDGMARERGFVQPHESVLGRHGVLQRQR